ncbi:hypothetical protein AM500_08415 [Bacillus sp. FJAT-18017]|uniref:SPOR domain-containing protein n=1 Tax=Bacillus sp. FJAT-18017 TaxID=1705566 RepID=UPI0006AE2EA8|nr:SPOR domain-containing protein [Bacillus sp. FJAT-18017]ALC89794.1 hypothetical protein AM500_08415 [Bacillus sp. FJAT-18017]
MDKPKNNTITIKINGDSRPYKEDNKRQETVRVPETKEMVTPAQPEQAAALEAGEESFEWILPEFEPAETPKEYIIKEATESASIYPKAVKPSKSSKPAFQFNTLNLKPIIVPVIFAILIGVTLGAGMLKLLISGDGVEEAITPTNAVTPADREKPVSAGKTAAATLQPITTFAVQEGIYTNKDSATSVKEELVSKGIPAAVFDKDGQAMMLVGVAASIEDAKEVGAALKAKGIEIYAKEVAFPEKDAGKLAEQDAAFLKKVPALYEGLSNAAAANITGGSTGEAAKNAQSELQKIDESKLKNGAIKSMYGELTGAATLLAGTLDEAGSIKAQQHLLDFLALYQSF